MFEPAFLSLLLLGLVCSAAGMLVVWLIAIRMDNYGIVDIAWSASFALLVVAYAAVSHPVPARAVLIVLMVSAWSLRLAGYLYRRIMSHHPVEDARYQDLRRSWGPALRRRMFWFFQAQGLAAAFLSLPFALALVNPLPTIGAIEWAGVIVWAIGLLGESTADRQLARFKADPAHKGRVCNVGLWRYSRHPNYFFEWVIWVGYALVAWPAPFGVLAVACPAVMLYLLLGVTGIPATEAAAVARRGEAYREYQRTTSAFVPWFPRPARS